jgi:hypothetical protein
MMGYTVTQYRVPKALPETPEKRFQKPQKNVSRSPRKTEP